MLCNFLQKETPVFGCTNKNNPTSSSSARATRALNFHEIGTLQNPELLCNIADGRSSLTYSSFTNINFENSGDIA